MARRRGINPLSRGPLRLESAAGLASSFILRRMYIELRRPGVLARRARSGTRLLRILRAVSHPLIRDISASGAAG